VKFGVSPILIRFFAARQTPINALERMIKKEKLGLPHRATHSTLAHRLAWPSLRTRLQPGVFRRRRRISESPWPSQAHPISPGAASLVQVAGHFPNTLLKVPRASWDDISKPVSGAKKNRPTQPKTAEKRFDRAENSIPALN